MTQTSGGSVMTLRNAVKEWWVAPAPVQPLPPPEYHLEVSAVYRSFDGQGRPTGTQVVYRRPPPRRSDPLGWISFLLWLPIIALVLAVCGVT